jgi:hypothetical protein
MQELDAALSLHAVIYHISLREFIRFIHIDIYRRKRPMMSLSCFVWSDSANSQGETIPMDFPSTVFHASSAWHACMHVRAPVASKGCCCCCCCCWHRGRPANSPSQRNMQKSSKRKVLLSQYRLYFGWMSM